MWTPSNTDSCRVPQQPGRTCDAPSGWLPHTGEPPRRPDTGEKCWSHNTSQIHHEAKVPQRPHRSGILVTWGGGIKQKWRNTNHVERIKIRAEKKTSIQLLINDYLYQGRGGRGWGGLCLATHKRIDLFLYCVCVCVSCQLTSHTHLS